MISLPILQELVTPEPVDFLDNATNVSHAKETEDNENVDFMTEVKSIFDNFGESPKKLIEQRKKFITMCEEKIGGELPNNFEQWTVEMQYKHLVDNIDKYFPNIPESLRFVLPAIFEDGDCGRPIGERPDWLNMNKFRRGQEFGLRHFSMVSMSHLMGLLQIFSFADGLKPLIVSQKSNTPFRAFKRYLSTIEHFRNWYTSDPWHEGTQAYRGIQMVRRKHYAMRQTLCNASDEWINQACEIPQNVRMRHPALKTITEDFANECPMMKSDQCPYTMTRMKGLNQGDMAGTQFACMGLMVLYPDQFGAWDATDEDLSAFCHFWRGIGYLLGIEDQYNFCRGELSDIRQRTKDMIEHWVKPNFRMVTPEWEHMTYCLYNGVSDIFRLNSYRIHLIRLCDLIGLNMPRLYDSLNMLEKMAYSLEKFVYVYLTRLPGVLSLMNMTLQIFVNRAISRRPKNIANIEKE